MKKSPARTTRQLSDASLANVRGGDEKKKPKEKPLEYLVIKMEDILVSSV